MNHPPGSLKKLNGSETRGVVIPILVYFSDGSLQLVDEESCECWLFRRMEKRSEEKRRNGGISLVVNDTLIFCKDSKDEATHLTRSLKGV